MLTHRERQYQEMETEASSIPGMYRSEPVYPLCCLSCLSCFCYLQPKEF